MSCYHPGKAGSPLPWLEACGAEAAFLPTGGCAVPRQTWDFLNASLSEHKTTELLSCYQPVFASWKANRRSKNKTS